jgi:acetyl esterase
MDLVTDPRLRELIELLEPLVAANPAPAVRQRPADPAEREAWFADVAELRAKQQAQMGEVSTPTAEGLDITEVTIPVTGSCGWSGCDQCTTGSINAIVYRPVGSSAAPAYVHFHGGGFWTLGGLQALRASAPAHIARALELGVVVVDVDYRLAPTHKFPMIPEDCYTALTWVVANADQLGVDPARLAVGGGSAGGALTATVTLLSRDRGGPALAAQVLHIPMTDSSCNSPSMRQLATGYTMTYQHAVDIWDMYLAAPVDAYDPYASPIRARSLRGLPPALVVLGDYDVLRDEGAAYGQRLVEDGVTVTLRRLPQTHGAILPESTAETERLINEHLRTHLLRA